jgi:hypothetical protein
MKRDIANAGDLDAADADEDLRARVNALRAAATDDPFERAESIELPSAVRDYLERKVAAQSASFGALPQPGQIVRVDRLLGPDGDLGEDVARPLCALIDAPGEAESVWWGWMVGAEADYSCQWDVVLGEEDEPRDPIAGFVQLWNPVRIYLPTVARVIGQLRPERLLAIRSLVADFLTSDEAAEAELARGAPHSAAAFSRATRTGHPVVTGLPLVERDDPRWVYQKIYEVAGQALSEPAAIVEAATAQQASWLATAAVEHVGANRFVARAKEDPELELELEFQSADDRVPLVLLQTLTGARHDAPIDIGDLHIEFTGGLATPDRDTAMRLAQQLQLPEVYARWPSLREEFGRAGAQTSPRMREAIKSLLQVAASVVKGPADVFAFLYPAAAAVRAGGLTRRAEQEAAAPVVYGVELAGAQAVRVEIWWPAGPPQGIPRIEVRVDDQSVALTKPARWADEALGAVVLEGAAVPPEATAGALYHDGALRLVFSTH